MTEIDDYLPRHLTPELQDALATARVVNLVGPRQVGKTTLAREEIVAELCTVFLGQKLGFSAHTLELNASYLDNWLRVLKSDKRAIFKHAADAQRACDYLMAASAAGQGKKAA